MIFWGIEFLEAVEKPIAVFHTVYFETIQRNPQSDYFATNKSENFPSNDVGRAWLDDTTSLQQVDE